MNTPAIVRNLSLTHAEKDFLIELLEFEVERYQKEYEYCKAHNRSDCAIEMWADGIKNATSILAELK